LSKRETLIEALRERLPNLSEGYAHKIVAAYVEEANTPTVKGLLAWLDDIQKMPMPDGRDFDYDDIPAEDVGDGPYAKVGALIYAIMADECSQNEGKGITPEEAHKALHHRLRRHARWPEMQEYLTDHFLGMHDDPEATDQDRVAIAHFLGINDKVWLPEIVVEQEPATLRDLLQAIMDRVIRYSNRAP
jgi:hypothetical protein